MRQTRVIFWPSQQGHSVAAQINRKATTVELSAAPRPSLREREILDPTPSPVACRDAQVPVPHQQLVFEEYKRAVAQAEDRVATLNTAIEDAVPGWHFAPVVDALRALRDVNTTIAATVVAWSCSEPVAAIVTSC